MTDLFEMLEPAAAAERFGRGPVDAAPWSDPAWYADEVEAVFKRSWLHVAHVCEVPEPGSFVRRELEFAKASLLIVRGKDGEVRAFHNVCTHRGTQLTEAAGGKQGRFSCPYHQWTFGTEGQLLSAPDFERFHVSKADCALKQVPCEVLAGLIFVHLAPDPAQTAREQFGEALALRMEELPMAKAVDFTEWSYEIGANWKIHFDNFQENYHVRFIHPSTAAPSMGPENPFAYPTHYGFSGQHRSQLLWKNPAPPPLAPSLKIVVERGATLTQPHAGRFAKTDMKLFPCFHIVWLNPDTQYTHTMMPLGPDRTRGTVRIYWTAPPENASRAFAREFAAMSLRDVLSEDRHAIEAAQLGLGSGALDRVNLQDHEVLLRHLYREVEARVTAWRGR